MLLVDDQIDSGWTMTVAAALLRDAGAPASCPWLSPSPPGYDASIRPVQATYGSAPVSLIIGRPATAQPVMPSATLTVFHPAPARAWAA